MKWFWLGFWVFLTTLVLSAAIVRPDTVDATLAWVGGFLSVTAWMLTGLLVLALAIGGGIAAWTAVQRNRVASLRQKDGHYPLQRVKVAGGKVLIIDPNAMVGSVLTIDRKTGDVFEHEPAAGWQIQATIRGMVERTRTAQAMFQGDDSRASKYGAAHRGDRITASAVKLVDGPRRPAEPMQPPAPMPLLSAPPMRVYTPADALNLNTRKRLVMGQVDGQLVHWDMVESPHLRVHGKSQGSGKTNVLRTLAAGALRVGHHVIVLDRRRFKDWSEFADKAELIDVRDPQRFVVVAQRLAAIYQERDALLGKAGAPNIAALENPPRRVVVVVAEFGALCAQADADGVLGAMLHSLTMVLREAGAAGVHVLIEDQVVDQRWPRGISTNAEPVTGYLPQNYGAAGGYYDAHKLPPYTFHFGGTVFKSLDARAALPAALATVKVKEPVIALRRAQGPVGEFVEGRSVERSVGSFGQPFGAFGPEVDPLPPNDRTTERPSASSGAGEVDPTDLQAMVWAWRDANPAGSQADLRRYFDDIGVEIARGYAHELWHRYNTERGG